MEDLPDGVASYWKSPEFSETSVPDNLLKSHRTKADTCAKIVILEGSLRYRVLESGAETVELSPDRPGIVEPGIAHRVELMGRVRFHLEFFR